MCKPKAVKKENYDQIDNFKRYVTYRRFDQKLATSYGNLLVMRIF